MAKDLRYFLPCINNLCILSLWHSLPSAAAVGVSPPKSGYVGERRHGLFCWGLFQCVVKLIECEYVESWEGNLLESVEMAVLGDDVVGSGGDGAVNELVVVLVDVGKQMEAEVGPNLVVATS